MNQQIEMLLDRWNFLSGLAAAEKVYRQQKIFAKRNGLKPPRLPDSNGMEPVAQIRMIRNRLKELIPSWKQYDRDCDEILEGLSNEDLMDIYIEHQKISINKVKQLVNA